MKNFLSLIFYFFISEIFFCILFPHFSFIGESRGGKDVKYANFSSNSTSVNFDVFVGLYIFGCKLMFHRNALFLEKVLCDTIKVFYKKRFIIFKPVT